MPTADYSSYHQAPGTVADGTKFSNFVDAVQATVNGLDTNNLTAGAGIKGTQIATIGLPGYTIAYAEFTADISTAATTVGTAVTVVSVSAIVDGGPVWVEFYSPYSYNTLSGPETIFDLFEGATDKGFMGLRDSPGINIGSPVLLRRRYTPSAGTYTYAVKMFVTSGTSHALGGVGGVGLNVPGYIQITKV